MSFRNDFLPGESIVVAKQHWHMRQNRMDMNLGQCDDIDAVISEHSSVGKLMMMEKNKDEPRALIDYKNWRIRLGFGNITRAKKPNALSKLATMAGLPSFMVVYRGEPDYPEWSYTVYPTNDHARQIVIEPTLMDDLQYRRFLSVFQGE